MSERVRVMIEQTDFDDLVHGHEVGKFGIDRYGNRVEVKLSLSNFGLRLAADIVNEALRGR
jgi:hypothetical protein